MVGETPSGGTPVLNGSKPKWLLGAFGTPDPAPTSKDIKRVNKRMRRLVGSPDKASRTKKRMRSAPRFPRSIARTKQHKNK